MEENSNATQTDMMGEPLPTEPTPKKKISKRAIAEIIGGILLVIFIVTPRGVPQDQYDRLQSKYESTSALYDIAIDSLEETNKEYNAYKEKMSKFEGMSDEEIDNLIAEVDAKQAEQKAAEEQAAAAAEAKKQAEANASLAQKNALSKADDYLSFTAFSYSGLIDQLEYEGFSTEDATYAADNCGADWNEQAAKKAQDYLDYSSFSRQGLIDQLLFEGFTQEQAEYGVTAVGY